MLVRTYAWKRVQRGIFAGQFPHHGQLTGPDIQGRFGGDVMYAATETEQRRSAATPQEWAAAAAPQMLAHHRCKHTTPVFPRQHRRLFTVR